MKKLLCLSLLFLSQLSFAGSPYSPFSFGPSGAAILTDSFAFKDGTSMSTSPKLPSGVILQKANKILFIQSQDGLLIQSEDSNTQTNAAGALNGGGVGQKAFVGFDNYDMLAFSGFTALSFNAKSIRDSFTPTQFGQLTFNNLANFNSGALTTANDYVNIIMDCAATAASQTTKFCVISGSSFIPYSVDLTNDRSWKVVGGTGTLSLTGDCTSGSNVISNLSAPGKLTVGMYLRVDYNGAPGSDTTCIPDGSTIVSINSGASTAVISNNATATAATQSLKEFGGIHPVDRSSIVDGSTALITGITNTADLQVNMLVTGTGVPAHSYIASLIANTSITLNQATTIAGTPTLSFIPAGKTGIPSNNETIAAVTWARILANNPNGYFVNTTPTVTGGWTAQDGGFPKNAKMSAFNLVQGSSITFDVRINALKSVTINSDVYSFGK